MLLLGLDVGTTGAKAIVFTPRGEAVGSAFREYGVTHTPEGYAEQDAEAIWTIACEVLRDAAHDCGSQIGAISVSVQGDAVVPIGRDRRAIAPVQLGMDYRGREEAALCGRLLGERALFDRTGMRPHPMNSIVKVFWALRRAPEQYAHAWKYVTYSDYFLAKLGSDEIVIDYTQASRTMAFDLREKCWSPEVLSVLGIDEEKLARPVPSCQVVGVLSRPLAESLGINPQAKLVTGGHDQTCAALGAGVICPDLALDSHGTAEVLSTVFSAPRTNDRMFESFYPNYCSLLPDLYFSFSLNHTAGLLLKWFAEEFCRGDEAPAAAAGQSLYAWLFSHMRPGPAPLLVLPYLNGSGTPNCDLSQTGVFAGLTLGTDRFDIAKAIVESLAFEARWNLECLREAGIPISALRAVGGGARTPAGLQLKADVLGVPVASLKMREAACLGAAMAAGLATGVYRSAEEAASLVQIDRVYEPDPIAQDAYTQRYHAYRALCARMQQSPANF